MQRGDFDSECIGIFCPIIRHVCTYDARWFFVESINLEVGIVFFIYHSIYLVVLLGYVIEKSLT